MKCFVNISVFLLLINFTFADAGLLRHEDVIGKITRFGKYEKAGEVTRYAAPETAAGYTSSVDNKHLEETVRIRIKNNIGFGFDYVLYNLPIAESIKIEIIAEHPPITNKEGVTYKISRDSWYMNPADRKYEDSLVYFFSNEYEMVPGKWTLAVTYNNKILVKKIFYIEK